MGRADGLYLDKPQDGENARSRREHGEPDHVLFSRSNSCGVCKSTYVKATPWRGESSAGVEMCTHGMASTHGE